MISATGVSNVFGDSYAKKKGSKYPDGLLPARKLRNFQIALCWTANESSDSHEWFANCLKTIVSETTIVR